MNFIILTLLLLVISPSFADNIEKTSRTNKDIDLLVAVFKFAFSNNGSALKNEAKFYALDVEIDETTLNSLIRRLRSLKKIYPASRTEFDCKKGVYLRERKSDRGIEFVVISQNNLSPTKSRVAWSYREGCLSAGMYLMDLEYIDGKWTVTDNELVLTS